MHAPFIPILNMNSYMIKNVEWNLLEGKNSHLITFNPSFLYVSAFFTLFSVCSFFIRVLQPFCVLFLASCSPFFHFTRFALLSVERIPFYSSSFEFLLAYYCKTYVNFMGCIMDNRRELKVGN